MKVSSPRIMAVVVTYFPDGESLRRLLGALATQVESVMIVDNSPGDGDAIEGLLDPMRQQIPKIRLVRRGYNLGVAKAQNIGIRAALAEEFDYVLLSDQDSLPDSDMVARLLDCCRSLSSQGIAVGCVCPEYFDSTTQQVFSFQVQLPKRLFYRSVPGSLARPWMEVVTTISSGMLIPRAALEVIGEMRDDFFIDHVDTEWCLRARAMGFHNFGTAHARLTHCLGDQSFRIWYFGWRMHSEYSPSRLYYRYRNFVLLCRLPHVPLRWSIRASWYWLGNIYGHCLFARLRWANARAVALGLLDGVMGRSGPLQRSI